MLKVSSFKLILVLFILSVFSSCTNKTHVVINNTNKTSNQIYNEILSIYSNKKETKKVTELTEEMERFYPYSPLLEKAKILRIYSKYISGYLFDGLIYIDDFIKYYPMSKYTDYIMYIKGVFYYAEISTISRDQSMSEKSKDAFEFVVKNYPNTDYALDASRKILYIINILAAKELDIGRYYESIDNYPAAINRYISVLKINNIQKILKEEALYRLIVCYYKIGLKDESYESYKKLIECSPNSYWTQHINEMIKKNKILYKGV